MYLDGLASCAELTTEDAEEATRSANAMRALLAWASRIARPGEGAPKLLMAIARLAKAEWVDGTPVIEISGTNAETTIAIFSDHGMGIRERLLPQTKIKVPVDEFGRAVRLAPQLISPFRAQERDGTLILTPPETDVPIEEPTRELIAIDEKSLHEQERKTAPPPDPLPEVSDPLPEKSEPATTPPPADAAALASAEEVSGVHTHPTVRRMVAVRPEAMRSGNDEAD